MKASISLILLILLVNTVFTQTLINQATIDIGNNSAGHFGGVLTSDGGTLTYNATDLSIIGDKTEVNYGSSDIWLVKFDENNQVIWDKSFGGSEQENTIKVIEKSNGNYVVLGASLSGVSGNKTGPNNGGFDIWVFEITPSGDFVWQTSIGGSLTDMPKDLIEINNEVWVLTTSYSPADYDKSTPNFGAGGDLWVIKIDSQGNLSEQYSYGGNLDDVASGMNFNTENNLIYITSESYSGITGNKTTETYGGGDVWMLSINTNGQIISQNNFGGDNFEYAVSKPLFINGSVYFSCSSESDANGNKESENMGVTDIWLLYLDENLNVVNQNSFGGDNYELTYDINKLNDQIIIGCVSFSENTGTVTSMTNGQGDVYILGINSNTLELEYQDMVGGDLNETILSILPLSTGNLRVLSTSNSDVSGDKTIPLAAAPGLDQFWMFDYQSVLNTENNEDSHDMTSIYPNPIHTGQTIHLTKTFGEVKVYDANMRCVKNVNNVSYLSSKKMTPGIYYISADNKLNAKIIVF